MVLVLSQQVLPRPQSKASRKGEGEPFLLTLVPAFLNEYHRGQALSGARLFPARTINIQLAAQRTSGQTVLEATTCN